jgi:hypothetical protein
VLEQSAAARIRRAFDEKGQHSLNLQPLFLGNWLADLSQLNDPQSTLNQQLARDLAGDAGRASVAARIAARVDKALSDVGRGTRSEGDSVDAGTRHQRAGIPNDLESMLLSRLSTVIREKVEEVLEALMTLTAASGGTSTRSGTMGTTLLSFVRVVGYLKFARPESNAARQTVEYDSYARIFDELCRQYFPHDHADRPLCSLSYGPTCEAIWEDHHAHQRDRLYASAPGRGGDRHMYEYLIDDRRILAARLAEIDRDWASRDLPAEAQMDTAERDLWLARLGHLLHCAEDFFAHSTFVEQAVPAALGPEGLVAALRGRSARRVGEPVVAQLASYKVSRRLQRYSPDLYEAGSGTGEREDRLATGYFDGWDTLNSFLHFAEELIRPALLAFETRPRRSALENVIRELLAAYAEETVTDVLDLFKLRPYEAAGSWEVKVHQALDGLLDYAQKATSRDDAVNFDKVRSHACADPVLKHLPESLLRDYLVPAVLALTETVWKTKVRWTVYKAVKAVSEFGESPIRYLLKPLTDDAHRTLLRAYIGIIGELVAKDLLVKLNYILLTELQDLFRADRVGCHSLLAKDQPIEPLFDEMFRCARHVDWFVVDTLCRWSNQAWVRDTDEQRRWVRWDDLLAFYLASPLDIPEALRRRADWRRARALRRHVVPDVGGTFRSVHQALTATTDGVQEVGTYEEFLEANLGMGEGPSIYTVDPVGGTVVDEGAVAALVIASGMGHAHATGYRLFPGLTVILPVLVTVSVDVVETQTWYGDVLQLSDEEWKRLTAAYERTRLTMSLPEFQHYSPTYYSGSPADIQRSVADLISVGSTLRLNLEHAYGVNHR